jgi:DNA-binding Lrp family transcriptional regulator
LRKGEERYLKTNEINSAKLSSVWKDRFGNYILPMARNESPAKKQFVMVDRSFINNKKLSLTAKMVGITLWSKMKGWKIHKTKIAKDLNISFKKLKASFRELENEGILIEIFLRNKETGRFTSSFLAITDVPWEFYLKDNQELAELLGYDLVLPKNEKSSFILKNSEDGNSPQVHNEFAGNCEEENHRLTENRVDGDVNLIIFNSKKTEVQEPTSEDVAFEPLNLTSTDVDVNSENGNLTSEDVDSGNVPSPKTTPADSEREVLKHWNKSVTTGRHKNLHSLVLQPKNSTKWLSVSDIIRFALKTNSSESLIAAINNYVKIDTPVKVNLGKFLYNNIYKKYLPENFRVSRYTFRPRTEYYEDNKILDRRRQTFYGFSIKNYLVSWKSYKESLGLELKLIAKGKNKWKFSTIWNLELVIAGMILDNKTLSPKHKRDLKEHLNLWHDLEEEGLLPRRRLEGE